MHAQLFSVADKRNEAVTHLQRNVGLLDPVLAARIVGSDLVRDAPPELIALNLAEVDRIEKFQWSPYYKGTNWHTAAKESPLDHPALAELLAATLHAAANPGGVRFPHPYERPTDSFLETATERCGGVGERVYFHCPYDAAMEEWGERFEEYYRSCSMAGSFELGFTTKNAPDLAQLSLEAVCQMADAANCLFTAALDGEGFLLWRR